MKEQKTLIKPSRIRLDASTICQLKCPCCPTANGVIAKSIVESGFLRFKDFKKLIKDNPWIRKIELSNKGEIFLNPDLIRIIKYSHLKKILLKADNGVNLNTASDRVIRALVKYRFNSISCSIDGASHEVYSIYRKNGNFAAVIKNIERINYYKKKYKSPFPSLRWQFVIFGHNEHEISAARQMAKNLNMTFRLKLNYKEDFSPVRDKVMVRKEFGSDVSSRTEYKKKFGKAYLRGICTQLWINPQINFDGRVLGCCENYWGDYGNAFKEGLLECLNGEKISYARQMLLGKKESRKDIPCNSCHSYKALKETCWLTREEIKGTMLNSFSYNSLKRMYLITLGFFGRKLKAFSPRVYKKLKK